MDKIMTANLRNFGALATLARPGLPVPPSGLALEQTRVEQTRVEQTRVEQTRVEQTRLEQARLEQVRLDKLALDKLTLDKLTLDKLTLDKLTLDKLTLEKLTLDKLTPEKMGLEKMGLEKMTLDNLRERPAAEQAGLPQTGVPQTGVPSDLPRFSPVDARPHKTVLVCDTQPVMAEGIRTLLAGNPSLRFLQVAESLASALELARRHAPEVIVVDKAFGIQAVLEWLNEVRLAVPNIGIVIWGVSVTEAEALRFLQAGARGILRKTAGVSSVLACLRTVAEQRSWMEDTVFRDSARSDRYPRSELTAREQQVLELVEQGLKNKEIALDLGIRPGTVKIHLKHIFEKTGVRGRYGLALSGLRDRGMVSIPA
jgi:two-component system nitrate/nitrite response regulator NarL